MSFLSWSISFKDWSCFDSWDYESIVIFVLDSTMCVWSTPLSSSEDFWYVLKSSTSFWISVRADNLWLSATNVVFIRSISVSRSPRENCKFLISSWRLSISSFNPAEGREADSFSGDLEDYFNFLGEDDFINVDVDVWRVFRKVLI